MHVCRLGILRLPRKDFHEISRLKILVKFADIPILINIGQKKKQTLYMKICIVYDLLM